jgi:predicted dehydrogenase
MIEQGLVGRVHLAEVDYFNGIGPWMQQHWWTRTARHGVSSMVNCGCHAMMLLALVMGGEMPLEVTSYTARSQAATFADYEFPSTQISLFRYAGDRVGKVTSCLDALQPYTFRLSVAGSSGSIFDDQFYSDRIAGLERARWSRMGARTIGDAAVIGPEMYLDFLTSFVGCVRSGQDMPRTNLDMSYRMHRMLFAADESAIRGSAVQLD